MANLSINFCRRLAQARRDRGMTQSALAAEVGCKQSAISMLEAGHSSKLSVESVGKLAEILGVPFGAEGVEPGSAAGGLFTCDRPGRAFCPNARCLSNVPYCMDGRLLFWPAPQPVGARDARACAVCGELLEHLCPHCGAALTQGACCPACGRPKVTDTVSCALTDAEEWAARRRREIAEWRSLQS
ncbi:MAG: helix-turn-helix transcriptional regulator [Kiritimatiellae bacterium]|nr:helix-turn-helix transcriptional regulator [Kiritimatiellia bacterium]